MHAGYRILTQQHLQSKGTGTKDIYRLAPLHTTILSSKTVEKWQKFDA